MSLKVVVNFPGQLHQGKAEAIQKDVADKFGICCEDVLVFNGYEVALVDVPEAMTKAREKQDAEMKAKEEAEMKAKADAERKAKESQAAAGHESASHETKPPETKPATKGR